MSENRAANDLQLPHGISRGIIINPSDSGLSNQGAPPSWNEFLAAFNEAYRVSDSQHPEAKGSSSSSSSTTSSPTSTATPEKASAASPSLTPIYIAPAGSPSPTPAEHTPIYIPPPSPAASQAKDSSASTSSTASTSSHGISSGALFAAIFVPIAVLALLASGCLLFFVRRRRRRQDREGVRELKILHQESMDDLSSGPYSARHSRAVAPFTMGLTPDHVAEVNNSPMTNNGPLVTVDGPSYNRNPVSPPPPYKTGGAAGNRTSSGSRSPPGSRSSQLSEANLALHRGNVRSPFADPDDDLVSEMSDRGERARRNRDFDAMSMVSDVSDGPGHRAAHVPVPAPLRISR
ncbi:MAG: hypothetical protein M1816_005971 [Peltula sp. TS41687]|nr:MAG: hypothetical protein M1816_005971 [Peltula sp. TS41687]